MAQMQQYQGLFQLGVDDQLEKSVVSISWAELGGIGEIIGFFLFLFSMLGVVLTAASPMLVGRTIADPINLISAIDSPWLVAIAMVIIVIATVSTNTAANMVSPTNDFQNALPKLINFKRGTVLTGLVGCFILV